MKNRLNFLFVLENYYPHIGGVEVLFQGLAEGLVKKGHKCKILTRQFGSNPKYERLNGVEIHRISCMDTRYLFTFFAIPKAIKLAKNADIIYTTTYNGAPPAYIASKLNKKPSVIVVSEFLGKRWNKVKEMNIISRKLHQFLEWLVIKHPFSLKRDPFDVYVAVSNHTKNDLLEKAKLSSKKIETIYDFVDYDFFNPIKYDRELKRKELGLNDNFVYMFFGRPGYTKGLNYLIDAVPELSKRIPHSKFLAIVSNNKSYEKIYRRLRNRINDLDSQNNGLNIKDRIKLLDPVPRSSLPSYIKAADCVVVPSITEGFGLQAAEACALDVPVVATGEDTSLREVVSGKCVFVKPEDSLDIAKGVQKVYNKKYEKIPKLYFTIEKNIKLNEKLAIRLVKH